MGGRGLDGEPSRVQVVDGSRADTSCGLPTPSCRGGVRCHRRRNEGEDKGSTTESSTSPDGGREPSYRLPDPSCEGGEEDGDGGSTESPMSPSGGWEPSCWLPVPNCGGGEGDEDGGSSGNPMPRWWRGAKPLPGWNPLLSPSRRQSISRGREPTVGLHPDFWATD